jgi:hypothetical protein
LADDFARPDNMSETAEFPRVRRRFSVAWCLGTALFHSSSSFNLFLYYVLALGTSFVDNGAYAQQLQKVLWFWSPFAASIDLRSFDATRLLLALAFTLCVGIAAGFLAPVIARWAGAQLQRRGRTLPLISIGVSKWILTAIIVLEVLWIVWPFLALRSEGKWLALPDWFRLRSWAAELRRSPQFAVYEGLPHQLFEEESLAKERSTKNHREVLGFPLYEPALTITPQDQATLIRLATTPSSFGSCRGGKLCGGFHPDYFLEWKTGSETYYMLLCFGCSDMILHHEKHGFMGEIGEEAKKEFSEVLQKYQIQRPKREP